MSLRHNLTLFLLGLTCGLAIGLPVTFLGVDASRGALTQVREAIAIAERWERLANEWCTIARAYDRRISCEWSGRDI